MKIEVEDLKKRLVLIDMSKSMQIIINPFTWNSRMRDESNHANTIMFPLSKSNVEIIPAM